MRATIDSGGRVVVPKAVRERLGLVPGAEVDLTERDGHLEVAPVPTTFRVVKRRGGVVLETEREMPELTQAAVRDVVEKLRR
jgi:AbrB family looped-hinge helix DNA binding protein